VGSHPSYSQGLIGPATELFGAEAGQGVHGDGRQEGAESLAEPQLDKALVLVGVRGEGVQPDVGNGVQDPGGGGIRGVERLNTEESVTSGQLPVCFLFSDSLLSLLINLIIHHFLEI